MAMSAKVMELRDLVDEAAMAYVTAYNHDESKSVVDGLKKKAQAAVSDYNNELECETYRNWNAFGDPVKTAIFQNGVQGTLKVSYKTDDNGAMSAKISTYTSHINLQKMERVLGKEVFSNPDWLMMCEKFVYLISNHINRQLGGSRIFSYPVSDAARDFEFPEDVDPKSDEAMNVAIQRIFDAILFIPAEDGKNSIRASSYMDGDVAVMPEYRSIREKMTGEGSNSGSVAIYNTGKIIQFIADAMHQSMIGDRFSCEVV